MGRQECFRKAIDYLRLIGEIQKDKDVALKMGADPSNVSRFLKSDATDNFLRRFNSAYGDIFNLNWLLTGEGEMLEAGISQQALGDGNTQVAGNGNHVNSETSRFLEEIAAQRRLTEKALEQYDRLLSVIERMQAGIAGGKP